MQDGKNDLTGDKKQQQDTQVHLKKGIRLQ